MSATSYEQLGATPSELNGSACASERLLNCAYNRDRREAANYKVNTGGNAVKLRAGADSKATDVPPVLSKVVQKVAEKAQGDNLNWQSVNVKDAIADGLSLRKLLELDSKLNTSEKRAFHSFLNASVAPALNKRLSELTAANNNNKTDNLIDALGLLKAISDWHATAPNSTAKLLSNSNFLEFTREAARPSSDERSNAIRKDMEVKLTVSWLASLNSQESREMAPWIKSAADRLGSRFEQEYASKRLLASPGMKAKEEYLRRRSDSGNLLLDDLRRAAVGLNPKEVQQLIDHNLHLFKDNQGGAIESAIPQLPLSIIQKRAEQFASHIPESTLARINELLMLHGGKTPIEVSTLNQLKKKFEEAVDLKEIAALTSKGQAGALSNDDLKRLLDINRLPARQLFVDHMAQKMTIPEPAHLQVLFTGMSPQDKETILKHLVLAYPGAAKEELMQSMKAFAIANESSSRNNRADNFTLLVNQLQSDVGEPLPIDRSAVTKNLNLPEVQLGKAFNLPELLSSSVIRNDTVRTRYQLKPKFDDYFGVWPWPADQLKLFQGTQMQSVDKAVREYTLPSSVKIVVPKDLDESFTNTRKSRELAVNGNPAERKIASFFGSGELITEDLIKVNESLPVTKQNYLKEIYLSDKGNPYDYVARLDSHGQPQALKALASASIEEGTMTIYPRKEAIEQLRTLERDTKHEWAHLIEKSPAFATFVAAHELEKNRWDHRPYASFNEHEDFAVNAGEVALGSDSKPYIDRVLYNPARTLAIAAILDSELAPVSQNEGYSARIGFAAVYATDAYANDLAVDLHLADRSQILKHMIFLRELDRQKPEWVQLIMNDARVLPNVPEMIRKLSGRSK